jgi:hypothetical protein
MFILYEGHKNALTIIVPVFEKFELCISSIYAKYQNLGPIYPPSHKKITHFLC